MDTPITADELNVALNQLKVNKAPGTDGIISELLIYAKDVLFPCILKLFQYVFETGEYPDQWVEGILHLVYKTGDVNDPSNYRDLTLLNCIGKLFDQILYNSLKLWEESNNILTEAQAGFRAGYSTTDHIFTLDSFITKAFLEKKYLYCAFIDMKKAFNSIFRQGLWFKLNLKGLNGKLLRIVQSMYSKIKCCVRGRKGLTQFFLTLIGVQQGAILSPYLFALYLNDLPGIINRQNPEGGIQVEGDNISLLMYADDMVALSNSIEGLQNTLDLMYDYCQTWKLTVNLAKNQRTGL